MLERFVMRSRLLCTPSQVASFLTAFGGHANSRKIQLLNGRTVIVYSAGDTL